MHPAARAQLESVVAVAERVLEGSLVGVYLYGSAVLGQLRRSSDIDVLIVVARPTTGAQRIQLVETLLERSAPEAGADGTRPMEVTIVRRGRGTGGDESPEREFQFGEWLRADCESGHVPGPVVDHDLAPLLATALQASVALVGPPVDSVLEPIPPDRLVACMRQTVPTLMTEVTTDTTNVLLTLARMWRTQDDGCIVTKDAAAWWALPRIPSSLRAPLEDARAAYLGEERARTSGVEVPASATARFLADKVLG